MGVCSILLAWGYFPHILFEQGIFATPHERVRGQCRQSEVTSTAYTELQQEGGHVQEGREAGSEWDKDSNVPVGLAVSMMISGTDLSLS